MHRLVGAAMQRTPQSADPRRRAGERLARLDATIRTVAVEQFCS